MTKNLYLEAPCLSLEILIAFHFCGNFFKVLLHLLAQARVETRKVREACDTQIKMQNMIFVAGEHFAEESGLFKVVNDYCERYWVSI